MGYNTVIGLAFGNSTSSIAFEKDGKVELIANQDGDRMIPSVVSYAGADEYHGAQAKAQLIRNAKNTVAFFRDFVGLPFDKIDPTNNHLSAHPQDASGEVTFQLKTENDVFDDEGNLVEAKQPHSVSVDQILTRHFSRLRDSAEDFIGRDIDGCVLAVPTDFTKEQREKLSQIASGSGLKVIQTINEPSAALLAHTAANATSSKSSNKSDKMYVVCDFGGSRTDGAVIASRGDIFTIVATLHDMDLGGRLLDLALCEFVAKEFEKLHNIDVRQDARAMAKLLAESEVVKKTLSNSTSANFAVESLCQGIDFHISINRLRFELIGRSVFTRLTSFITELVSKANLDVLDVDQVLLAGGSSYIPKLASSVAQLFAENPHCEVVATPLDSKAILPDELIARGCAIQASLVSAFDDEEIQESLQAIVTVAPHLSKPIGIEVVSHHHESHGFVQIVPELTALPIRKTHVVNTGTNENVLVRVCEGNSEIIVKKVEKAAKTEDKQDKEESDESDWSDDEDEDQETRHKVIKPGKVLAELALKGVQPNAQVEVVINISRDLKLQVAARELRSGGASARGEC